MSKKNQTEHFLDEAYTAYQYTWPTQELLARHPWKPVENTNLVVLELEEKLSDLDQDSRWPALFPSPICIVTNQFEGKIGIEKVVGPSIVNRFPYVVALNFCKQKLSDRHYCRETFMSILENSQNVAIHFFAPGATLDKILKLLETVAPEERYKRLEEFGLNLSIKTPNPVFEDAFLVYEAKTARPMKDFHGVSIYEKPYQDVGSHRIYFLEINRIQLDRKIAENQKKIYWRSLPIWKPKPSLEENIHETQSAKDLLPNLNYVKSYTPHYIFPSNNTVSFEYDEESNDKLVKHLSPLPQDQVEVDNDRARWPCFFPSSLGVITTRDENGKETVMPCGSTTILSRHPLTIAICVSYSKINIRYAPRATLDFIKKHKRFGCGIAYIDEDIINAINYTGNVSYAVDPDKFRNSGFTTYENVSDSPILCSLPIHFDCEVIEEIRLGTHIMFLGKVKRIFIRKDVSAENPLTWYPWANTAEVS